MKVIGLTGGFGTGKTYVASLFRRLGARIIDADAIAHKVIRKGSGAYKKTVKAFGKRVLSKNGEIDRGKLANVVFDDRRLLKKLEKIIHPEVIKVIKEDIRKSGNDAVIVIDAPLLIEAGLARTVDKLVVVTCSREAEIKRCRKKFRAEKEEILKRIRRQIPIQKKKRMADFIIDNSLTRSATKRQVQKLWRESVWR